MERERLEELWSRWVAGEALTDDERRTIVAACGEDATVREQLLEDRRLDAVLRTLGRASEDGEVFARRFIAAASAEQDGGRFASAVEKGVKSQVDRRSRRRRRLGWLIPFAAAAFAAAMWAGTHMKKDRPAAPESARVARPAGHDSARAPLRLPAVNRAEHGPVAQRDAEKSRVALLVVGSVLLTPEDSQVKDRLEAMGFTVRVRGAEPIGDEIRQIALVAISGTTSANDVGAMYRDVPVPVITWEPALHAEMGLTGPSRDVDFGWVDGRGDAIIKKADHPLAAGLTGTVRVLSAPGLFAFGVPGPSAIWIASMPHHPSNALLFAYDEGAPMPGLAAAPARRVAFFLWATFNDVEARLTEAGWALFEAAVRWCLEKEVPR